MDDTDSQRGVAVDALSDDTLAIARFIRILLRGKWTIFLSVVVTAVFATAIAWMIQPMYRSQVLLAYVSDEGSNRLGALSGQLSSLASLPGLSFGQAGGSKEETIALLGSRDLSEEFIMENQLLPELFPDRWDSQRGDWQPGSEDGPPGFGEAFKRFDQEIRRINVDAATGLVTLSIDHFDRVRAAFWANQLVSHTNERVRNSAILEANQSIEYLQAQLDKTNVVELQQSIYRLIEAQLQKIVLANVRQEYSFKVIDPAVIAEDGDIARPNRPLIVVVGLLAGAFIGVFIVIVRQAFRQLQTSDP